MLPNSNDLYHKYKNKMNDLLQIPSLAACFPSFQMIRDHSGCLCTIKSQLRRFNDLWVNAYNSSNEKDKINAILGI
jgi:hypothetical protein